MIHLDSVEKAAARINEYLHDPNAFGDNLKSNRRKRLQALRESLNDSLQILDRKLGIEHEDSIDTIINAVVSRMESKQEQSESKDASSAGQDAAKSSSSEKKSPEKGYSGAYRSLTKQQCGTIYRKYLYAMTDAPHYSFDNPAAHQFAEIVSELFDIRFNAKSPFKTKYNVLQIAESIEQLFVAFAVSQYTNRFQSFMTSYYHWKDGVTNGSIKSTTPYIVMDYMSLTEDKMSDNAREFIMDLWCELLDGPFSCVARINVYDAAIKDAFLRSNPISSCSRSYKEGGETAAL